MNHSTATAPYTGHREGSQGDTNFTVTGRGSRVPEREDGRFRIVHEHRSRSPRPP